MLDTHVVFSRPDSPISHENIDADDEPVPRPSVSSSLFTKALDVKNSLGFQDYPDIYDQKGHIMKFKFSSDSNLEINCNLCLDDIDVILGYF